jgi:SAM-dependent methyltransferase
MTTQDMSAMQTAAFGSFDDYDRGSPHLVHRHLRHQITELVRAAALARLDAIGHCRVLEVGAGHGSFTDHVLACGAEARVTEMSAWAHQLLAHRYRHNPRATVVLDTDGGCSLTPADRFDLVLCISVLHHIPDYLAFLRDAVAHLEPGGTLLAFQDPLHHPSRTGRNLRADRAAFLAWRIGQGHLRRGLATQMRRLRGKYDETNPGDMVEYHVVRQGVDQDAIVCQLEPDFDEVTLTSYWSTPSSLLQRLGDRWAQPNTFGIVASGRRPGGVG